MDVVPFKPSLVRAVFRDVTPLQVSRAAAWAAASVTGTVLAEIVDGARRAAAAHRSRLTTGDLLSALDRDVELEVGCRWYEHSPTFRGLTGGARDVGRGSRKPRAVAGAHRFEAGVRKLLRSRGATAVPALVRDLDGIASVFLTDLARDAAMVVSEGGARGFGTVTLVTPDEPSAPPTPLLKEAPAQRSVRAGDRRTVGSEDVLAAAGIQLFGGGLRHRALAGARETARRTARG
ncbi:hypothetical protein [Streptomyces sp. NPDC058867]|uniref:hypothetical protein n=1 Tax=unclassified Streptomyces TaxID=2593676 RepID=UPI003678B01B